VRKNGLRTLETVLVVEIIGVKWARNSRRRLEIQRPGSSRHQGFYREREPASSHFFIWLPKRNPVRTRAGSPGSDPTVLALLSPNEQQPSSDAQLRPLSD